MLPTNPPRDFVARARNDAGWSDVWKPGFRAWAYRSTHVDLRAFTNPLSRIAPLAFDAVRDPHTLAHPCGVK